MERNKRIPRHIKESKSFFQDDNFLIMHIIKCANSARKTAIAFFCILETVCWVGPTERRYPVTHREDKKMWNCHINLVRCVLDSVDILGGIGCAAALVWTAAVTGIHTKKKRNVFCFLLKVKMVFFSPGIFVQ